MLVVAWVRAGKRSQRGLGDNWGWRRALAPILQSSSSLKQVCTSHSTPGAPSTFQRVPAVGHGVVPGG